MYTYDSIMPTMVTVWLSKCAINFSKLFFKLHWMDSFQCHSHCRSSRQCEVRHAGQWKPCKLHISSGWNSAFYIGTNEIKISPNICISKKMLCCQQNYFGPHQPVSLSSVKNYMWKWPMQKDWVLCFTFSFIFSSWRKHFHLNLPSMECEKNNCSWWWTNCNTSFKQFHGINPWKYWHLDLFVIIPNVR